MLPQLPQQALGQKAPNESAAQMLTKQNLKKEVYEGGAAETNRKAAIQRRLQKFGGPPQK
jgi:hypothetical protein